MPMHRSIGNVEFRRVGDDESRTYEFVISTIKRDRHKTVVLPSAWRLKNFNANGIVAYMHKTTDDWWTGYSADPDDILGPGEAFFDEDQLVGRVTFETEDINPKAEKIKKKIDFGTLKAASVGFNPIDGHWGDPDNGEDSGTYYYTDVDLLEFSIVNIPSNPEALMRSYEAEIIKSLPPQPKNKKTEDELVNRADLVRENQLFINQKFLEDV